MSTEYEVVCLKYIEPLIDIAEQLLVIGRKSETELSAPAREHSLDSLATGLHAIEQDIWAARLASVGTE